MFIKFGDKTKTVVVKDGKVPDEGPEDNTLYLDEDDEADRRASIINKKVRVKSYNDEDIGEEDDE